MVQVRFASVSVVVCCALALNGVVAALPTIARADGVLENPRLGDPGKAPVAYKIGDEPVAQINWDRSLRIAADSKDKEESKQEEAPKERSMASIAKDATVTALEFTTTVSAVVFLVGLGYCYVASDLHSDAVDRLNAVEDDPESTSSEKRQARDEEKRTGDNLVTGFVVTVVALGVAFVANWSAKALRNAANDPSAPSDASSLAFAVVPASQPGVPFNVLTTYRW